MSDGYNQGNDPKTGDSNSAQNAGNTTSQPNPGSTDMPNDDESRGGPPTGEKVENDARGLTDDADTQKDALGSA